MSKSKKSKRGRGRPSIGKTALNGNSKKSKRGRGRPPGAKNKNSNTSDEVLTVATNTVKRKAGRPPGAKNKVKMLDTNGSLQATSQTSDQAPVKRGPGRPSNAERRGRKRNTPLNSTSPSKDRQSEQNDRRGPGRPTGANTRNRNGFPAGYTVMGNTLLINLDEADITSVYYSSTSNKSLKCSPLE